MNTVVVHPDHWEVKVVFDDSCAVLWRVVAENARAAEAHVKTRIPAEAEARGASLKEIRFPKFVQGHSTTYEVA